MVERGIIGADDIGGVPGCTGRGFRAAVGSVVRREFCGWVDVAGMFPVGDARGEETAATAPGGLSVLVGTPKAALLGEFGLDDA